MTILEELLASAYVEVFPHSSKDNEINIDCPFCVTRGKSDDTEHKLGINVLLCLAHCHRCDWGGRGLRHLLKALSKAYNVPIPKLSGDELLAIEKAEVEPPKKKVIKAKLTNLPPEYEKFKFDDEDEIELMARKYLKKRGITNLQIAQHKIGFAAVGTYAYRVIFPVFGEDSNVYGYACRSFADSKIKYLNSDGTKLLWGAHRTSKVAIEVEGIMDALSIERAFIHQPDVIGVAPLGSAVTDTQLKQLTKYSDLVLFPDRDKPGVLGCIKRAWKYYESGLRPKVVVPLKLDEKDPGDLSPEEIRLELQRAEPWTEFVEYRMRGLREIVC